MLFCYFLPHRYINSTIRAARRYKLFSHYLRAVKEKEIHLNKESIPIREKEKEFLLANRFPTVIFGYFLKNIFSPLSIYSDQFTPARQWRHQNIFFFLV